MSPLKLAELVRTHQALKRFLLDGVTKDWSFRPAVESACAHVYVTVVLARVAMRSHETDRAALQIQVLREFGLALNDLMPVMMKALEAVDREMPRPGAEARHG
jgi:hypothetical protein